MGGSHDRLKSPETAEQVDATELHMTPNDVTPTMTRDDDPVRVAMKEAGLGDIPAEKTAAVGHEKHEFKKGDKVIYEPTGRKGKITSFEGHAATVEFDDDVNPNVRNVFVADLKKASKTAGLSFLKEMAQEALDAKHAETADADPDGDLDDKEAMFLDEGMMGYIQHKVIEADGGTKRS